MKLNWGFGIGAVYVIFVVVMILFAVVASRQHYDLVSENYYDDAVAFQHKIDGDKNASLVNSKLFFNYLENENSMELSVIGPQKTVKGTLQFYKPDMAKNDFQLTFSTDESGKQIIPLKKMTHGYWKIFASWNVEGKNCNAEKEIFIK